MSNIVIEHNRTTLLQSPPGYSQLQCSRRRPCLARRDHSHGCQCSWLKYSVERVCELYRASFFQHHVRYLFAQNLLESGDHFLHYIASWQLGCTRGWMAVTDTESVGRVHDVQELPSSNTLGSATLTMRSCFGLCSVKRIRWVSIVIT